MGKHKGKILLAVDGSDQAFETVRYVSQLFPPKRMETVLFHVATKVPEGFWDVEKNPAFKHKLSSVAAWATRWRERGSCSWIEASQKIRSVSK
jgi:hypothetical protein